MKNSLTGGAVAAGTGTTGLVQMMNWIPDDIGKLACLVSIIVSIVIIVSTVSKTRLQAKEKEKLQLEINRMKVKNDLL